MIYLDNAATTKPRKDVIQAMTYFYEHFWFNPSSLYAMNTKKMMDGARTHIANNIKAKPNEIYFTSGATEGNNWILRGFFDKYPKGHIIVSEVEHKSIIECCKYIQRHNGKVHIVPVDSNGVVKVENIEKILEEYKGNTQPKLVSVQYANNETGVIQPIAQIADTIKKYENVWLHTDATQWFPYHFVDVKKENIDFMTISGHKFGCPKGIGFAYIKEKRKISPLIFGSQENGMRGGTENMPYIEGLVAAVIGRNFNPTINNKLYELRLYFEEQLESIGCKIHCKQSDRLENVISCELPNMVGELMLYALAKRGIYISTGSACNLNSPSYVLKAMGLSIEEIQQTIRISMSDDITKDVIDKVVLEMKEILL